MKNGNQAPAFSWKDKDGNVLSKENIVGKSFVVFFYPKNFSPVCTKQACAFSDSKQDFDALNCEVFGVSQDSEGSHIRFTEKFDLTFPLISDPKGEIYEAFGVKKLFGLKYKRETFVFNRKHELIGHYSAMLKGKAHVDFAIKTLKEQTK